MDSLTSDKQEEMTDGFPLYQNEVIEKQESVVAVILDQIPQGASSRLNSDTLDGFQAVTASKSGPNKLVATNSDGRIGDSNGLRGSSLLLDTPNGHGSTNTCIRNFTVQRSFTDKGDFTVVYNDATNGTSVTIVNPGIYAITYAGDYRGAGASIVGLSKNSNQLTTAIGAITATDVVAYEYASTGYPVVVCVVIALAAGDVIRPHSDGLLSSTLASSSFRFIRI